jgi:hypothetical protein
MRSIRTALLILPLALPLAAGCSDTTGLSAATSTNRVDTVSLHSLIGTPISTPSAFSITANAAVRTDQTSAFDFAYNLETAPDGTPRHLFLPLRVLGLSGGGSVQPGLQPATAPFDAITKAVSNGYTTNDTVPFVVGDRFYIRSRSGSDVCPSLGVPLYGKLEVLSVDDAARTVTFRVLTDNNCGYRSLEPGLPSE